MRTMVIFSAALACMGASACSRPVAVRSLANTAMPIATNLQDSATRLQTRLGEQRSAVEGRLDELTKVIELTQSRTTHVEDVWRFSGQKALAEQLAQIREKDGLLLTSPLGSSTALAETSTKPPKVDTAAIEATITDLNKLGRERKVSAGELLEFAGSINSELAKLEKEQADAAKASGS